MGVVMLYMPPSETGPFRCMVEKLLIRKTFRGRGGARVLMGALEAEALNRQRTMLVSFSDFHCRLRLVDRFFTAFGHGNRKPCRGCLQKTGIHRSGKDPQLWHQPHGRAQGRHVLLQRYISAGVQRIIKRIERPRVISNGIFVARYRTTNISTWTPLTGRTHGLALLLRRLCRSHISPRSGCLDGVLQSHPLIIDVKQCQLGQPFPRYAVHKPPQKSGLYRTWPRP